MGSELVQIEGQLKKLAPEFTHLLAGVGVAPERLMQSIMVSVEKNPTLLQCSRQSVINAAMSAATLGLVCDGYTGQAHLIPFRGQAQLVIGYKGYNTLAARSGYTVNAAVVREGDKFEFALGTGAFIHHWPKWPSDPEAKLKGAWATAEHNDRPPIVPRPLSIADILAVRDKSPGAKRKDSPWNDYPVGFEAMACKTAMRRLARSMPLNVMQLAAALETQVELGQAAYVNKEKGVVIDTESVSSSGPDSAPAAEDITGVELQTARGVRRFKDINELVEYCLEIFKRAPAKSKLKFFDLNEERLTAYERKWPNEILKIRQAGAG